MRHAYLAFALALTATGSALGQEYTITDTGTLNSSTFSSLPGGTSFIFTATFNAATAVATADPSDPEPDIGTYVDPLGTAEISFANYDFTASDPQIRVFSAYGGGIYGYEISATDPGGAGFATLLQSPDASVAPDTSLSSFHTSPILDFGPSNELQNTRVVAGNAPGAGFGGVINNFTVEISGSGPAVPEPSSIYLLMVGLGFLSWRRKKLRLG